MTLSTRNPAAPSDMGRSRASSLRTLPAASRNTRRSGDFSIRTRTAAVATTSDAPLSVTVTTPRGAFAPSTMAQEKSFANTSPRAARTRTTLSLMAVIATAPKLVFSVAPCAFTENPVTCAGAATGMVGVCARGGAPAQESDADRRPKRASCVALFMELRFCQRLGPRIAVASSTTALPAAIVRSAAPSAATVTVTPEQPVDVGAPW